MIHRAYALLRPLLFRLDAERAHELMLGLLSMAPRAWGALIGAGLETPDPSLAREVGGVLLAGPVGLAAGLDKDGLAIPFWPALGFGSVEVGTVTAHAQPGNPRPRLFRLPADRALINRMGFNNRGSAALADRLRHLRDAGGWPVVPVGVNVGKSKITPLDEAHDDYAVSVRRLRGLADWFTINVSSPNTPGLRSLQGREHLQRILDAVLAEADDTPVWLKLAPDLSDQALTEAVELACARGVAAVVATNTTIEREGLRHDPGETGGLSGAPLWPLARRKIDIALDAADGRIPVIGVGGISTPAQVRELLAAGCAATQLYTALIYEGPGLPSRLHRAIAAP